MKYREAIDFLYEQLPAYQRIGKAAFKKDLTNIKALCALLDQPQEKFRSIHIAGTNGKGSVSHMLASVFQEAGYKVGLYTSPHLFDFRERIKVSGQMISKNSVIHFLKRIKAHLTTIQPSFFEITVAMAFDHFNRQKVDIAIIETGLGGRLDSTNILIPELSVITNIGFDHMNMLGDSLKLIAGEKAGIIKPGVPVLIGKDQKETRAVFKKTAKDKRANLHYIEEIVTCLNNSYSNGERILKLQWKGHGSSFTLKPDLIAAYQSENINTALSAIRLINRDSTFKISAAHLKDGLENVMRNTGFAGRWQVLRKEPLIILDGAHNEPGLEQAVLQLKEEKRKDIHILYGCVSDKDLDMILGILPKEATYYLTRPPVQRAKPLDELESTFRQKGFNVELSMKEPMKCLEAARKKASQDSLILITGSIFLVGAVLDSLEDID